MIVAADHQSSHLPASPYVGPQPFRQSDQDKFFGRDGEATDLINLIRANTEVLIYSESGAGKTSLLNARLIPGLAEKGFEVLPVGRLQTASHLPPLGSTTNSFIYNILSNWAAESAHPGRLARTTLANQLKPRVGASGRVLFFDQFEELFTLFPQQWADRPGFFQQVRETIKQDRNLHVVFVMREDYIAQLDPHAEILPDRLRVRFHLQRLRKGAALEAIAFPLRKTDRTFAPGVADTLVSNLLEMNLEVDGPDNAKPLQGEFCEPVQLQVVCDRLWQSLPPETKEITHEHLKNAGSVDDALTGFFNSAVAAVAAGDTARSEKVSERDIRLWIDRNLISPTQRRAAVLQEQKAQYTAGLPNAIIDALENARVLRGDWRGYRRWFELSHDRLLKPVRLSNDRWYQANLNAFQRQADLWCAGGRVKKQLAVGELLAEGEAWIAKDPSRLTEQEKEFLEESRNQDRLTRETAEREARSAADEKFRQERENLNKLRLADQAAVAAAKGELETLRSQLAEPNWFIRWRMRFLCIIACGLAAWFGWLWWASSDSNLWLRADVQRLQREVTDAKSVAVAAEMASGVAVTIATDRVKRAETREAVYQARATTLESGLANSTTTIADLRQQLAPATQKAAEWSATTQKAANLEQNLVAATQASRFHSDLVRGGDRPADMKRRVEAAAKLAESAAGVTLLVNELIDGVDPDIRLLARKGLESASPEAIPALEAFNAKNIPNSAKTFISQRLAELKRATTPSTPSSSAPGSPTPTTRPSAPAEKPTTPPPAFSTP